MKSLKKYFTSVAFLAASLIPFENQLSLEHKIAEYGVSNAEKKSAEEVYVSPSPSFYPSNVSVDELGNVIVKTNKYNLGEGVLGRCWRYGGLIEMLEGLNGDDLDKVKEHEIGHREHPERSELENRVKTYTENVMPHYMVSCNNR